MQYDPEHTVDPVAWQAMDESERIAAVERYHRRQKPQLPRVTAHATIHAVVENQIAEGDKLPTKAALARLMREGLDRHDAVHAIGAILSGEMYRMLRDKTPWNPDDYALRLERLTAEAWRKEFGKTEEGHE